MFLFSCAKETIKDGGNALDNAKVQIQNRSDDGCFTLEEYDCFEGSTVDYGPVDIEVYPGCLATVSWTEERCEGDVFSTGSVINALGIYNFSVVPKEGECMDILDEWNNLESQGDIQGLIVARAEFEDHVSEVLEALRIQAWYDDGLHPFWFNCGANFGSVLHAVFSRSSCTQTWKREITDKGSPFSYFIFESTSCGSSCCKRTTEYCRDEQIIGGQAVYEIINLGSNTEQIGDCFSDLISVPPGRDYTKVGSCSNICE